MGVKIVYTICALATVESILLVSSLFAPLHKMTFFGLGFKIAQMNTHALYIEFPYSKQGLLCKGMYDSAGKSDKKNSKDLAAVRASSSGWCDSLEGSHEIQDVAMHMCAPAVSLLWPQFCNGLNAAYTWGVFLTIASALNMLLQAVGCFFLYDYVTRKANPTYRTYGGAFLGTGGLFQIFSLGMYYMFVVHELSSISSGWTSFFLSTNKNESSSHGFVILVVACVINLVELCLYPMVAREYLEDEYLDQKLAKEEGLEYGSLGSAAQPAGGFGMQPAPMMQPMMQPMGQTVIVTGVQPAMLQPVGVAVTYNPGPSSPHELGSGAAY